VWEPRRGTQRRKCRRGGGSGTGEWYCLGGTVGGRRSLSKPSGSRNPWSLTSTSSRGHNTLHPPHTRRERTGSVIVLETSTLTAARDVERDRRLWSLSSVDNFRSGKKDGCGARRQLEAPGRPRERARSIPFDISAGGSDCRRPAKPLRGEARPFCRSGKDQSGTTMRRRRRRERALQLR
jgi:hypothetical protein